MLVLLLFLKGTWVKSQRYEYKKFKDNEGRKTNMTEDRIHLLEDQGFAWAPKSEELTGQDLWLTRYDELKKYKNENGHCKVPKDYPPNQSLGNWVITQRELGLFMTTWLYLNILSYLSIPISFIFIALFY